MLVIRNAQIEALCGKALASLRARFIVYLGTLVGDVGDAEISRVCDRLLSDCAKYSIERYSDICRFAEIVLRDGSSSLTPLPKNGKNIMLAHGVPAAERLSSLEEVLGAKGAP